MEVAGEEKGESATHLASNPPLQKHRRVLIDKLELLQHLYPLLVVRQQLEILVRDGQTELGNLVLEDLLGVDDLVLYDVTSKLAVACLETNPLR